MSQSDSSPLPPGASPWPTVDPFLFCVHHLDHYPRGNAALGPAASLEGRHLGMDFEGRDGWRMYHGQEVPGFPQHPHRGFETVTLARRGLIDHSDSMGATARFGRGDVQWMTAGRGVVHSEMFPLLRADRDNPVELFQIWLNLPKSDKMVEPYFTMLWSPQIPVRTFEDRAGRKAVVTTVAGALGDTKPPTPPPNSWAAKAQSDVAIWTLQLEAGARWTLPAAAGSETARALYFFDGQRLRIDERELTQRTVVALDAQRPTSLVAGEEGPVECLLLQGRPLREPVAHHGPFVMNTHEELRDAVRDYQQTRFGGWPWKSSSPVHPRERARFARHADGRIEEGPEG